MDACYYFVSADGADLAVVRAGFQAGQRLLCLSVRDERQDTRLRNLAQGVDSVTVNRATHEA